MKRRPGEIRDAIALVLEGYPAGASLGEIVAGVQRLVGQTASSSVRSYLRLNTPEIFERHARGHYSLRRADGLREPEVAPYRVDTRKTSHPFFSFGRSVLHHGDCLEWLCQQEKCSIHAVVTAPPYGLFEYSREQQEKLRIGRGGVWRIPPSFDGVVRSPLPRFTILTTRDLQLLDQFFF
jgi:site-specific DNA-methyltransferase (adenine-specific)